MEGLGKSKRGAKNPSGLNNILKGFSELGGVKKPERGMLKSQKV